MTKHIIPWIFTVLILAGCTPSQNLTTNQSTSNQQNQTQDTAITISQDSIAYTVTVVSSGRKVPRGIVALNDTTLYITERNGSIYKLQNNNKTLYHTISNTRSIEEAGLMGITLDPNYDTTKFVYVSVASNQTLQILRFTDTGTGLTDQTIIISALPVAKYHAGGGIKFGPDRKLYLSVGDAQDKELAQDLSTYHGKLLRINADGSLPTDNPFSRSAIWSYGHRNIQGFDRDVSGNLYASEHGPSGFDGPGGGDEINHIITGGNYGRPTISHQQSQTGIVSPMITYTPAVAPSGLIIYKGSLFPQWTNKIITTTLKGEQILVIDPSTEQQIDTLFIGHYGRLRNLIELPNGEIIFTTSNTDGRGIPHAGDDTIYKISADK